MKIAIDVTRAVIETAGIGRWTYEITQAMLNQDKESQFIIFSTHFNNSPAKEKVFQSFKRSNVKLKRLKIPGSLKEKLWESKVPFLDRWIGADVLYAPSYFEVLLGSKIPQVVTIHDMTADLFPTQRGEELSKFLSKRTLQACQKSKFITCVSESTRNDLIKIDHINADKTAVVYPGLKIFEKLAGKLPFDLQKEKYILSVGTIEPRKNLVSLLKAYSALDGKVKEEYPLILVGSKGWNDSEIFDQFKNLNLERYVRFTGFVDDAQLARLYSDCKVFAYVSLYEGFGLPPLEAMSFGRAVLSSDISSIPEVVGKAGVLVKPTDISAIQSSLSKLLTDTDYNKSFSKAAKDRAKQFDWNKSGVTMLEILKT